MIYEPKQLSSTAINKKNNVRMTQITYWSLVVALAGFLFGFDTAVISGADQPIQQLWQTSALFHGLFIMSSSLWGTVIGALFGHLPCDRYGRKLTLIIIGILYIFSAFGSALAPDPYTFSIMRFVGGLGVGISSIAVPAYISEIAPAHLRGRLVALYQFQLVFGILVAYFSNFLLSNTGDIAWRLMLGVEAIPALIYLFMILPAPESPRWLLLYKKDKSASIAALNTLQHQNIESEITEIIGSSSSTQCKENLFSRRYFKPSILAFLIAAFNQLSGINFIIYFAPRVFSLAGLDQNSALLSTIGVGFTNLIFTLLGLYLIDRLGRRSLMLIGSLGYIFSLTVVSYAFYADLSGLIVVLFIFLFIASHAIGQGAVIWVFIAEIFPNSIRAKGQALGCGTHWVFAALISLSTLYFLEIFSPQAIFAFFAIMMVFQLLYTIFLMPETKGKSLEEIASEITPI